MSQATFVALCMMHYVPSTMIFKQKTFLNTVTFEQFYRGHNKVTNSQWFYSILHTSIKYKFNIQRKTAENKIKVSSIKSSNIKLHSTTPLKVLTRPDSTKHKIYLK